MQCVQLKFLIYVSVSFSRCYWVKNFHLSIGIKHLFEQITLERSCFYYLNPPGFMPSAT
uniref:Uncharacterized protein n=1 Tax=Anguilla anguilla TaxID=7936 RepID=A0A0E9UPW8_ANGAN